MTALSVTPWNRHARRLLGAGLLVALAGAAVLAQAQPGPMGGHRHHDGWAAASGGPMGAMMPGMMHGRHAERMLEAAGVSAEQRAQIRQLLEAARSDGQATRETRRTLHEQLRQAFTQPTVDANTVEALRQQQLAQFDATSKRRMQLMLDISRVLTPEQRVRLAERIGQRHERMMRRAPTQ